MPSAYTIVIVVVPLIILISCLRVEFGRIAASGKVDRDQPLWRRLTTHLLVVTVNGRMVNLSPAIWAAVIVCLILWFSTR